MAIFDINDYVDRYMNDYIVYHPNNFFSRGDAIKASNYFHNKYEASRRLMMANATDSQIQNIYKNMKNKTAFAAKGIDLANSLANGTELETALDYIAIGLQEKMDAYMANFDFSQTIKQAVSLKNMLSQGVPERAKIDRFFKLLIEGMTYAGKINLETLDKLTEIGRRLTKDGEYKIPQGNYKVASIVNKEDINMANKVIEYLNNAVYAFENTTTIHGDRSGKAGTLGQQSFGSTINNIFSKIIGEALVQKMAIEAVQQAQIDETVNNTIFNTLKSMGISVKKSRANSFVQGGSRKDVRNRTSKADMFNNGAFQMTITENINGQKVTTDIDLGLNLSVKWSARSSKDSTIKIVSGTPFGSYFQPQTPEYYFAYNIITHRFDKSHKTGEAKFHELFRELRAATAATYFDDWISGTGEKIKNSIYYNKVQFIVINGKIFPIQRIVNNICKELEGLDAATPSKNMPFDIRVTGGDIGDRNKWEHDNSDPPNLNLAIVRSRAITEVINKLTISATFNNNILTKYAY